MILLTIILLMSDTLYLDIPKSIDIALKQNRDFLSSREYLNSATATFKASQKAIGNRSTFTPGIKFSDSENSRNLSLSCSQAFFTGGNFGVYTDLGQSGFTVKNFDMAESNNMGYGVSFSQPLFTDNLLAFDIKKAKFNMLYQKASYELSKRTLILSVIEQFYGIIKAKEILKVQEEIHKSATALVNFFRSEFKNGLAIDIDLLEAQLQLYNTESALSQARVNLEQAKEEFANLLYLDPSQKIEFNYEFSAKPLEYKTSILIDSAVETYPLIKSIDNEIALANIGVIEARREFQHNLTLTGSYGKAGYGTSFKSSFEAPKENWSVSLQTDFSIFDNGVTSTKVGAAKYTVKALTLKREGIKKTLETEINQEVANLTESYNQYQIFNKAIQVAENNLHLSEAKMREGIARGEIVVRSQNYFINAKLSLVNTIVDYNLSKAKLYFLTKLGIFSF